MQYLHNLNSPYENYMRLERNTHENERPSTLGYDPVLISPKTKIHN